MKEALLYIDINEKIDRDIYTPTNYMDLKSKYYNLPSNSGNKLWLDAVEEYICQDNISYSYYTKTMSIEEINSRFNFILYPTANLINIKDEKKIIQLTSFFKKVSIPTYIIGLGLQAKFNNDLIILKKKLGRVVCDFIDAILSTGGAIGVRGYITKEFIANLGFDQPKVIGCPSLFVNGPSFKIDKEPINNNNFIPIVNGDNVFINSNFSKKIFDTYKEAIYIDQDTFRELLYESKYTCSNWFDLFLLINKFSYEGIRLLSNKKIYLFYDIPVWKKFLIDKKFNFCVGNRIHGNIISIICGIPTAIIYKDLRVKEIADYMSIPLFDYKSVEDMSLCELYDLVNYDTFNNLYNLKYQTFKNFFDSNGITNTIGDNSKYKNKISKIDFIFPPKLSNKIIQEINNRINKPSLLGSITKFFGKCMFNIKHLNIIEHL